MFVTGCVKFERVGRALSAQVIVLIAASIAIGRIILKAVLQLVGRTSVSVPSVSASGWCCGGHNAFVTILTNFASNATATVGTPIAFSIASQLGIPAEPLVWQSYSAVTYVTQHL